MTTRQSLREEDIQRVQRTPSDRCMLIAEQTAALKQLLQTRAYAAPVGGDDETNIELTDLREMLKQASVRLVLLQKAHMQALKDNASLENEVRELRQALSAASIPPIRGLAFSEDELQSHHRRLSRDWCTTVATTCAIFVVCLAVYLAFNMQQWSSRSAKELLLVLQHVADAITALIIDPVFLKL